MQRRDAVECIAIKKSRPESDRQQQLVGTHDRGGGHRGLPTALGALVNEGFALQQPSPAAAAPGRHTAPPSTLKEVLGACAFRRKAALISIDDRGHRCSTGDPRLQGLRKFSGCQDFGLSKVTLGNADDIVWLNR